MILFDYVQALWAYLTVFSVSGVVVFIIILFLFDLLKENTHILSSSVYFEWRVRVKAVLVWFTVVFLVMVVIGIFVVLIYWLSRGF